MWKVQIKTLRTISKANFLDLIISELSDSINFLLKKNGYNNQSDSYLESTKFLECLKMLSKFVFASSKQTFLNQIRYKLAYIFKNI